MALARAIARMYFYVCQRCFCMLGLSMSTPPALPDGFSSAAPSTHERNIFQLRPNHHVAAVATALAERADDLLFDLAEAVTHEALLCDASTFLPRDSRGKVRAANN